MIKVHEYRLPLKNGTWRQGLILQNGDCFGDVAPLPGFSQETFAEAKEETLRVIETGEPPKLPSVRFAFRCASVPFPSALQVSVAALNEAKPGFRAVKLKVGDLTIEEAIDLVKRTTCSEIRLDFNRKWSLEKLLRFADHFLPTDFAYLEEPTQNWSDLLTFSKQTQMPIAVDESIPDIPYWEIPTLKAVIVKPTILGEVPYIPPNTALIFSSAYESGVGLLHIAKLCELNPTSAHGLDSYSALLDDVLNPRPVIENGHLTWASTGVSISTNLA